MRAWVNYLQICRDERGWEGRSQAWRVLRDLAPTRTAVRSWWGGPYSMRWKPLTDEQVYLEPLL